LYIIGQILYVASRRSNDFIKFGEEDIDLIGF